MPAERTEVRDPPVLDFDRASCRYSTPMQKGGVLKGARLLHPNIEAKVGIRYKYPRVRLDGASKESIKDGGCRDVPDLLHRLVVVVGAGGFVSTPIFAIFLVSG